MKETQGKANPHQVVMQRWIAQGSGRVGQVALKTELAVSPGHRFKTFLLQSGHPVGIPFKLPVCEGQVAVDPPKNQLIKLQNRLGEPFPVLPVASQPRHPRIEFELHCNSAASSLRYRTALLLTGKEKNNNPTSGYV